MSGSEAVGYGHPPRSTQFKKGASGNPRGRPRNRTRKLPYDAVLGQMVTVREDGRERRVSAAEAFLLQLTKKGLEGDSAASRASLAAMEAARAKRTARADEALSVIIIKGVEPGSVSCAAEPLGIGMAINRTSKNCRLLLAPWIVTLALSRLDRELSPEEQRVVWDATRTPSKVTWPKWWGAFG